MFLLHIKNFKLNTISGIKKIKNSIKVLNSKILLLKQFKKSNLKEIHNNFIGSSPSSKNLISIKLILGISVFKTNTIVYLTDIKGKLKFLSTAGSINLYGKQKTKKPVVILKLLQNIIHKVEALRAEPIVLHLKNFNESLIRVVVSMLNDSNIVIGLIKNYRVRPHNGCRPKKIKRKKRRKILFQKK